jgi:hypothetical protein
MRNALLALVLISLLIENVVFCLTQLKEEESEESGMGAHVFWKRWNSRVFWTYLPSNKRIYLGFFLQ